VKDFKKLWLECDFFLICQSFCFDSYYSLDS